MLVRQAVALVALQSQAVLFQVQVLVAQAVVAYQVPVLPKVHRVPKVHLPLLFQVVQYQARVLP